MAFGRQHDPAELFNIEPTLGNPDFSLDYFVQKMRLPKGSEVDTRTFNFFKKNIRYVLA